MTGLYILKRTGNSAYIMKTTNAGIFGVAAARLDDDDFRLLLQ